MIIPKKAKCPRCGKRPAIIHPIFGVLNCKECKEELERKRAKRQPLGTWKSLKSKMEYYATPFWKVMGLKAKPEEKAIEKEMKRKGLTYLDLQKARVEERKKQGLAFDATNLKKQLEKGELPRDKEAAPYWKLRPSRNGAKKTISKK